MFIQSFCLPINIDNLLFLPSFSQEPVEPHYSCLAAGTDATDISRSSKDTIVFHPIMMVIYPTPNQFCSYFHPEFAQSLNDLGQRCKVDVAINVETSPEIILIGNAAHVELARVQLLNLLGRLNGMSTDFLQAPH
ncbi:hypothetical protein BCV72DRAFT_338983 [Rhizopus microsporus var. microsporus]|uniref:Uncharacterized protein n=1 Tax=Rhizopus microsporus var. microsporus TaxID=86635 RepID=A0A1X0QQP5_RHIZD|nr:hypothetical protein BCV72DRAFT_338983 [Rhizopus microsporus var. microsporus]